MKLVRALASAVLAVGMVAFASPAVAGEQETLASPQVKYALEVEAGGVAVDYWTAVWPETGMRLDVTPKQSLLAAVGSCANGRICAFNSYGEVGTMPSWATCGTYSTTALGSPVRSIANARTSGVLKALNGSTTVASAAAGSSTNVYATVTNVSC